MNRTYLLIFLSFSIIINSCTKEKEEFRLSDFNIPAIDGYYLRDYSGEYISKVGMPNVKLSDGVDYSNSAYFFISYPNPCTENICFIAVKAPISAGIKKLWITQAKWNNRVSDEMIDLNNTINTVVGGSPVFQTEFTSDHVDVDLTSFSNGYYRIYLKVNDYLLYDNLVIYKLNK
jgi:hypothetical protein